jgi:DNA (cytosine-5)-methyltransferase 1
MSGSISQVSYQKIGVNRGNPRLWIEGVKLGAAGFARGARYSINFEDGAMELKLDPDGHRIVSGKTRHGRDIPILDITLKELEQHFSPESRVRVVFTQGCIKVSLHHETAAQQDREARFRSGLKAKSLSEASMFSGGGVSTHAIHKAISDYGHKANLSWVVDAELRYLQSGFANNYAINDETVALIGRAEEIETAFFKPVDVLSFSMPCSGFSRAGKSKHGHDPEAHEGAAALFGTMNAIRASNPAVLISENVVEAQSSPAYILLKTEIERLGYKVFERVMDASDTGSAENRRRYWFVALSNGIADGFTFDMIHDACSTPRRAISELLEPDVPDSAWAENQYLKDKALRDAKDGKGFARQLLTGSETSCGTIGRHYMKRRSTEPFLVREDGKERLFTPVEHARMKSVPEELVDGVAATVAHEILGQSVDYRQAYIAMAQVMAHVCGAISKSANKVADVTVDVAKKTTKAVTKTSTHSKQLRLI